MSHTWCPEKSCIPSLQLSGRTGICSYTSFLRPILVFSPAPSARCDCVLTAPDPAAAGICLSLHLRIFKWWHFSDYKANEIKQSKQPGLKCINTYYYLLQLQLWLIYSFNYYLVYFSVRGSFLWSTSLTTLFYFCRKTQTFSEMEITSLLFKINSARQNELIAMHSASSLIRSQPFQRLKFCTELMYIAGVLYILNPTY